MALVYLAGASALFQLAKQTGLVRTLGMAGRMSLTNYLLQSMVANVLFMGWGFGLHGMTSVAQASGIAAMLYLCQLMLGAWWMKRSPQGPVEWVWRRLAYS